MTDVIPLNENDNIGGLETIDFALVTDVASIPDAVESLVPTGIIMNTGKRFYSAPFTLETGGFTETPSDSEHGTSYDKQVTGFCACDCNQNAALFEEMENARFIVKIKDNNGNKRLVGTIAEPLQFKVDRSSQQTTGETPGATITFYGKGVRQSPFYNI